MGYSCLEGDGAPPITDLHFNSQEVSHRGATRSPPHLSSLTRAGMLLFRSIRWTLTICPTGGK